MMPIKWMPLKYLYFSRLLFIAHRAFYQLDLDEIDRSLLVRNLLICIKNKNKLKWNAPLPPELQLHRVDLSMVLVDHMHLDCVANTAKIIVKIWDFVRLCTAVTPL